jgi:hypothetical protein
MTGTSAEHPEWCTVDHEADPRMTYHAAHLKTTAETGGWTRLSAMAWFNPAVPDEPERLILRVETLDSDPNRDVFADVPAAEKQQLEDTARMVEALARFTPEQVSEFTASLRELQARMCPETEAEAQ